MVNLTLLSPALAFFLRFWAWFRWLASSALKEARLAGDQIQNCATLSWSHDGNANSDDDCSTVTVANADAKLDPDKNDVTSGPYLPGDMVRYRLRIKNDWNAGGPYMNPIVTDLLPDTLAYVDDSWTMDDRGLNAPAPTFEKVENYNGTGRTLLRWNWDHEAPFNINPNQYIYLYFEAAIKTGAASGKLYNTINMSANGTSFVCRSSSDIVTDEHDLDGDDDTSDILCKDTENITISPVAAMDSVKWVKGQLDADWHKFPESGLTVPGGLADYRLIVTNSGNVPMTNLQVVDILPFVGDTGVIDPQDRLTEWRPNLVGAVAAPAGVTVYYSTEENPCRPEVLPDGPAGCSEPNWSTIPPADITTVQSLKFDFGGIVLDALDSMELTWPMRAPLSAPTNGEIAWNSFGYVADRIDTGGSLLPSEPIKVGIAVQPIQPAAYGNYVWVDTNNDGIQNEPANTGFNNVRVELYVDNGDNTPDPDTDAQYGFTITMDDANGNPGYYQFTDMPAGCYFAKFYEPVNYDVTSQDEGDDEEVDSDVDAATGLTEVTCLDAGEIDFTWDMGLVASTTAAVGNYVWFDQNEDGIQNESSADGINGITVKLYQDDGDGNPEPDGQDGSPIETMLTGDDLGGNPGYYLFDGLNPGDYFICFDLPTGGTFTSANAEDDDTVDSDADTSSGCTEVFTLNIGDNDLTRDAGMILPTGILSLGDRVWYDADNDGTYEPFEDENGIDGVKVNLYRDSDDSGDYTPGTDEFVATATTFTKSGAPGYYEFTELTEDDYIVQIDPANFRSIGALNGLTSSTGNEPTPDPDDNMNDDDNGDALTEEGTVAQAISLTEGEEPEREGNHNPTVDFGFTPPLDMGDAPESDYPTLLASDGARHVIDGTTYLGAGVDADANGQPSADADGDDNDNDGDDEDGVTFLKGLEPGSVVNLEVEASAECTLSAWVDFHGDGWDENDSLFAGGTLLSAGTNRLSFSVPVSATTGINTYSRFRCTTSGPVSYDGPALDGEVEDYMVAIVEPVLLDFGDAPDPSYPTLVDSNGAHHVIDGSTYLGASVDDEEDGQPTAGADGDDTNGDDEDGVTFGALQAGSSGTVDVVASAECTLSAWIDFNGDGSWAEPQDELFPGGTVLSAGNNSLSFTVPMTASTDIDLYSRFRCTTTGPVSYEGAAADGEVEDHIVQVSAPPVEYDFGDAPSESYPTGAADNGANHIIDNVTYLGLGVDADDDGQPTSGADGDDNDASGDDEDGVSFITALVPGSDAEIKVVASSECILSAWIDFNRDGWDAADNLFPGGKALTGGGNDLTFSVPMMAAPAFETYARFRCTTEGPVSFEGTASDGEVEDYVVRITDSCDYTIGNLVWLDSNGDGNHDDDEPGIENATVTLIGAGSDGELGTDDDVTYDSQQTNDEGQYQFTDLEPGNYQVSVDQNSLPEGYVLTSGNQPFITLADCQNGTANFGYTPSLCERSVLYGVHDAGSFNSQFFMLNLSNGVTSAVGPLYDNYDVESIEIHPETGQLYAIAGGDGDQDGKLFTISKENGSLTQVGDQTATVADFGEVVSAAFDDDGILWGFQEGVGLVTVDLTTGAGTLAWSVTGAGIGNNWEGLAWDPSGDYLYGSDGTDMYAWDPSTQTATQLCGDDFLPDATEALDFRFDGKMLGGWHNATDNALSIFEIDIASCEIIPLEYSIPYNDVESLASEECVEEGILEGTISDGGRAGQQGVAGLELKLEVDTDGDGSYGFTTHATTDDEGNYQFVNLPYGTYRFTIENSTNDPVVFDLTQDDTTQDIDLEYGGAEYKIYLPTAQR